MMTKKIGLLFKNISILCLIVFLAVGVSGCTATRHTVQKAVIPSLDTSVDDLVDKIIRQKVSGEFITDSLPGVLLLVTGLVELAPTDYKLLATTSFLYAALGLFVEDEDPDYAISLYDQGKDFAMRAMEINNPKFSKAVAEKGAHIADAVQLLTKDDLKATLWYGVNLAKRITLQLTTPEEILAIPDAIAIIKRGIEIDPNYSWGIDFVAMGIVYSILPAMLGMGGGAEAAMEAFTNANRVENGELGLADVFKARYLCPLTKDHDEFYRLNNRVIAMDPCKLAGGLCIINELGKQKARFNLEHKAKYMGY